MTNEDLPRWAQGKMHPHAAELYNPPAPVVTPLNGITSGLHMARCAEMAEWIGAYAERLDEPPADQQTIANWFAYLAGSTDQRPA